MPVDDRLRDALARQADSHVPAVEEALDSLHARVRWDRRRAAALGAVGAAAASAVVAGVVGVIGTVGTGEPAPTGPAETTPTTAYDASPAPLRGTITGDVRRPASMRGEWSVRLAGNGSVELTPPPGTRRPAVDGAFTADGSTFRTTLFSAGQCSGTGTGIYSWERVADVVTFTTIGDDCGPRERFLTTTSWRLSTEPRPRG